MLVCKRKPMYRCGLSYCIADWYILHQAQQTLMHLSAHDNYPCSKNHTLLAEAYQLPLYSNRSCAGRLNLSNITVLIQVKLISYHCAQLSEAYQLTLCSNWSYAACSSLSVITVLKSVITVLKSIIRCSLKLISYHCTQIVHTLAAWAYQLPLCSNKLSLSAISVLK